MNAKEEYNIRLEMSDMHEEFIDKMSVAYDDKFYVEAVWYCYAIFDQRISRLIAKYIDKCTRPKRTNKTTAAISTRINCLKKLVNTKYGAFDSFDVNLLNRILDWCHKRNELVHGLVSLEHYKKYDDEFKKLASLGVPLVFELYDACTNFRNKWYESDEPKGQFPINCKCKNNKCINENCI